jgi:hypothetical protein
MLVRRAAVSPLMILRSRSLRFPSTEASAGAGKYCSSRSVFTCGLRVQFQGSATAELPPCASQHPCAVPPDCCDLHRVTVALLMRCTTIQN